VLGGVTAVFEMPNTKPNTDSAEAVQDKLARAKDRMWCDHAFYVGATSANAPQLAELERLPGTAGVKIFMGASTGDLLVAEDSELARRLRKRAAATGKRLSFMNEYLPEERDPVRCWLIVAAVAFVTLLGNR